MISSLLQIAQRIRYRFTEEDLKNDFSLAGVSAQFSEGVFFISYSFIKRLDDRKKTEAVEEMLRIAAYCLHTYEFKGFKLLEFVDLDAKTMKHYSREQIFLMGVR